MTEPTFIGIGALKAGTTSIYTYLMQHPDIFVSPIKEPRFFALEGVKLTEERRKILGDTITCYEDYLALFDGAEGYRAVGEISPIYLSSKNAAKNIHERLPGVKLFAILRDPVNRMFSNYVHNVRSGYEQEVGFLRAVNRDVHSHYWNYVPQSCYYEGLKPYFDLFDRSQIMILYLEDLKSNPTQVITRLYEFLGVGGDFVPTSRIEENVGYIPKSRRLHQLIYTDYPLKKLGKKVVPNPVKKWIAKNVNARNRRNPTITPEERRQAITYIEDDVRNLAQFLDKDLDQWLTP